MKLADLIQWIQQYDENKGLRRKANQNIPFLGYLPFIGRIEPTVITLIKELISEIKDREDLSDFNLFQLAKILANTPTEKETESEKIAGEIANTFGGIELLKNLEEKSALSFHTVYLLTHDPSPKELLCYELIGLHANLANNPLLDRLMECLSTQKAPFGIYLYIELLSLICSIHFTSAETNEIINYNDKLPDLLQELVKIEIWNLGAVKRIINLLLRSSPSLLNYENLISVFKFNRPEKLELIINSLPVDQEQFNFLATNQTALNSCNQFNKIYHIFAKNNWNINPFFNAIVTEKDYENKIFYAINRLDELKINRDFIIEILKAITAMPANSTQLVEAIANLGPDNISQTELHLLINNLEGPDPIVDTINELKKNNLYSIQIQSILSHSPKQAAEIGDIILTLDHMNCLNQQLIEIIGYYPKCIANFALLNQINTSIEMNLNPEQIKALLFTLALINTAQLLTQQNVDLLFSKLHEDLNLLPDFLTAIYSLKQDNELNQINFDTLISNTVHVASILTILDIPLKEIPSARSVTKLQDCPKPTTTYPSPNGAGFFQFPYSPTDSSRSAWLRIQEMASSSSPRC